VDPALGPDHAGCERDCSQTGYGCCPDGLAAADGPDFAGCESMISPAVNESAAAECTESAYGCCEDGVTAAYGPHFSGCPERIRHGGDRSQTLLYSVYLFSL